MDGGEVNLSFFSLAVFVILFTGWGLRSLARRPSAVAMYVSLAHFIVAGMNAAAPVRGRGSTDCRLHPFPAAYATYRSR